MIKYQDKELLTAAFVAKGLEQITKEHIIELLGIEEKKITIEDGVVFFSTSYVELCKFCYYAQSVNRVILFIEKIAIENKNQITQFQDYLKNNGLIQLKQIYRITNDNMTFRVICKSDEKAIDTMGIESILGAYIIEDAKAHNKKLVVNLKNPELLFYSYMHNNKLIIGLDFSDDLSKRDYKIFNSPMSLKGTTAFGLLKIAGYNPSDVFLDTFCNSGNIVIEAALYANRISPRYYNKNFPFMKLNIIEHIQNIYVKDIKGDWESFFQNLDSEKSDKKLSITASDPLLRNITAAKKNAKIAGVEKYIDFRRIDIDWLDTKFDKKTIDKIITFIPGSSKHKNTKILEKLYTELFYQAEFIIKNNGSLVILCLSKDLLVKCSKQYFTLIDEKELWSGEQLMHVLFFKKLKAK